MAKLVSSRSRKELLVPSGTSVNFTRLPRQAMPSRSRGLRSLNQPPADGGGGGGLAWDLRDRRLAAVAGRAVAERVVVLVRAQGQSVQVVRAGRAHGRLADLLGGRQ